MSSRIVSSLQRKLLPFVLLSLVLAQTLGALHRVVHARGAVPQLAAKAAPHGLAALFAGHASEQGCEVYDQLSHADLLPGVAAVVPVVVAVRAVEPLRLASHPTGRCAGFLARAPPRVA
ncbi:MAG: hypothetical protein ABI699_04845 [Caldimonas sp.]